MPEHHNILDQAPATLVELLRGRALKQPDAEGFTFLPNGEIADAPAGLTYGNLDRRARMIGALLQSEAAAGQRALLLFPPGLDYIAAFFGCLYAGVVGVPAYPPALNRSLPRLEAIAIDAQATLVLTTPEIMHSLEQRFVDAQMLATLRWLTVDQLSDDLAADWRAPQLSGDDLVFLQYTSGSTSTPKGVMLTHRNLLHNLELIRRCFEHTDKSRGVIWLPPYHDMGLIGGILQPLYAGFPVTLMSPVAFLQKPVRWLEAISHYRATTSGGPNFAYDLCVQKIPLEQRAHLDLSSWRVAFSGAEPVQQRTLQRFSEAFASSGFRSEALYPCYGLAEATLLVTGGFVAAAPLVVSVDGAALRQHELVISQEAKQRQDFVGCGQARDDQHMLIVHPESHRQATANEIGEIWVSSPSVARGYWNRPEETSRVFQARLADSQAGPLLRTGDLGFLHEGQLYITGRLKDLIIIRGRNHYPQDIERTVAESHPFLRPNAGAAFQIEADDEERLVVVQEVERQYRSRDLAPVIDAIRAAVAAQHEIGIYAVLLLPPGAIPKTSSGKIQRYACRNAFLDSRFSPLLTSTLAPSSATDPADEVTLTRAGLLSAPVAERQPLLEAFLKTRVAALVGLPAVLLDREQPLTVTGLDSLAAVELQHLVEITFGASLSLPFILQGATIVEVAACVLDEIMFHGTTAGDEAAVAQLPDAPLTYGQQALWLVHELAPESGAYNVARVLRIRGPLDPQRLHRAFESLLLLHPALRTTFHREQGVLAQRIHESPALDYMIQEAAAWAEPDLNARLHQAALQRFELSRDLPIRVRIFARDAEDHLLLLVIHHIVVDFWSFAIILEELAALYTTMQRDGTIEIPTSAASYADFARWQQRLIASPTGAEHGAFWQQRLRDAPKMLDLPLDRPRPPVQTYHGATQDLQIPPALTQQLKGYSQSRGATLYMTLLTALQVVLGHYSGQDELLVGSPMLGRSRAAWDATVGYFVNPVVLSANLAGDPSFEALLDQTRQTVLAALEHQDYPFPLLVERLQLARDPSRSPLFQVMFIFQKNPHHMPPGLTALALDQPGGELPFGDLRLETLALRLPIAQFDLSLRMAEIHSSLTASLEYNTDLFDDATIARMLEHFQAVLEGVTRDGTQRLSQLTARLPRPYLPVKIAATFTAEPVLEPLRFWLQSLKIPARLDCAPYNQVFQHLLDPSSSIRTNRDGINVLLIRPEDWSDESQDRAQRAAAIEQSAEHFLDAVRAAVADSRARYFVSICPPSENITGQPVLSTLVEQTTRRIMHELSTLDLQRVVVLDAAQVIERYAVPTACDPVTDRSAHIPYTATFFVALSTQLARMIFSVQHPPYKVIVLDCDETLWDGRCGEDGAAGVWISPWRVALQELLVQQHDTGKLLCLCSKNIEDDVLAVFRHHSSMPLGLKHIIAHRINWESKATNLKALAQELQLSLESFIFIDDHPVECAEVRASCPEVLTIQMPTTPEFIPAVLDHLWGFDPGFLTREDQQRTTLYLQNQRREQFRAEQPSLEDFLDGLGISVTFAPVAPETIERVAQLTQRTNQFNTTTIRRSTMDLQQLLNDEQVEVWTAVVSDRFGDYGLVGVLIAAVHGSALVVDSLLLSCRALGKHVEDTMLMQVVQIARQHGCEEIQVLYAASRRNAPALNFLRRVGLAEDRLPDQRSVFHAPVAELLAWPTLERTGYGYRFGSQASAVAPVDGDTETPSQSALNSSDAAQARSALLSRIATELQTAEQIAAWIQAETQRNRPDLAMPYSSPQTKLEALIAAIWREVLNVERVGIHDNFFELGGHSIMMGQIQSRLQEALAMELPIVTLFRYPTISALAQVLDESTAGPSPTVIDEKRAERLKTGTDRLKQLRQRQQNPKPGGRAK